MKRAVVSSLMEVKEEEKGGEEDLGLKKKHLWVVQCNDYATSGGNKNVPQVVDDDVADGDKDEDDDNDNDDDDDDEAVVEEWEAADILTLT